MNKDNKKFIIETLFLKEALKYNLTLKEFIVLMYFDNDYDLTFDIKKISKATCLSENDTLIAFNSLLTKKLIKLNQIKNEGGKVIDKVSLENFYNNLKETIDLEKEEKNENSIFFKFQEKFGKNYDLASKKFINAIEEIDKTIDHLQKTKEALLQNVKDTMGEKDSVVILMHDSSDKILTYEMLSDLISYLREQGYKFENIYDLLD